MAREQRMQRAGTRAAATALALSAVLLAGCAPRTLLLREVADALAAQAQAPEDDLLLARDTAPVFLKVAESLLVRQPDHLGLVEAVAGGFTQYAQVFLVHEADRVAATDVKAAQALRQRAARLFLRARNHALTALEWHQPGLGLDRPVAAALPVRLRPDLVGVAYWGAAAWASRIALSKDRPDEVADLPQAVRLAALAFAAAPGHGDGSLASLMATLEAARPGGSRSQAQAWFAQAEQAGAGKQAAIYVTQAESLAQPAGDRAAFEALLRQAMTVADAHPGLANAAMRERAQWLLANADDLF